MSSSPLPLLSVKPHRRITSPAAADRSSPHSRSTPVVTARGGVRRSPRELRGMLAPTVGRKHAMELLSDPEVRDHAIANCRVVTSPDGKTVDVSPLRRIGTKSVTDLVGIRRLGSYHGARSSIATHSTRFSLDGRHHIVFAESLLELAWMTILDRREDVLGYRSQGCVVSWPIKDIGFVNHFIDLTTETHEGMTLMAIKPDHHLTGFASFMLEELLPDTCRQHGLGYDLLGSLSRQCHVNLRALSAWRWKHPVSCEPWWSPGTAGESISLGRLARECGGAELGRTRAIRAIAQCHLDIDLEVPIRTSTIGVWR